MSVIRKDRKTVIGILGGGQLARMSAFQAIRLGFDIAILEKTANSPAGVLTKNEFVGWVDDENLFKRFIDNSDIITLENEFIDYKYLEIIESSGKKVIPSSKTISLIQDKFIQKKTLSRKNIPVPEILETCLQAVDFPVESPNKVKQVAQVGSDPTSEVERERQSHYRRKDNVEEKDNAYVFLATHRSEQP